MNNSVMYWKWDDANLDLDTVERKVEDFVSRTQIGTVFIGHHWCSGGFFDERKQSALAKAAECFEKHGRKTIFECCYRNEGTDFFRHYPNDRAYLISFFEIPLDENGRGTVRIAAEPVPHYHQIGSDKGDFRMFDGWAVNLYPDAEYDGLMKLDLGKIKTETEKVEKDGNVQFFINAGVDFYEAANKTAILCIGFLQPIPDLASPNFEKYFERMIIQAKESGSGGFFTDEWGYDVILKIEEPNPYDDRKLIMSHHSVSDAFDRYYVNLFRTSLYESIINLRYTPKGRPGIRLETVNRYLTAFRKLMAYNDEVMYNIAKKVMGKDAFVGVHPTWWGSTDKLNFEYFKNGFYWWQAKRDYAQTDEMVIMPIRTALARKCRENIWYNMWYSMGSRDLNTYFTETWKNLLFGGRTHYLGYECPNESVVLELYPEGMLEKIEEMDERVRMTDPFAAQPDSRVLVLYGYEAAGNWAALGKPRPPWTPENVRLDKILNTANDLFSSCLCDLVPSYEIDEGALKIKSGLASYGNHTYDIVIVLYPGMMSKTAEKFLAKLDKNKLIICYGEDRQEVSEAVLNMSKVCLKGFDSIPTADTLCRLIKDAGVPFNRFENGCKLNGGAYIFGGDGKKPSGNVLNVKTELEGKCIEFSGEDFLYYNPCKDIAVFPCGALYVNGKSVLSKVKL